MSRPTSQSSAATSATGGLSRTTSLKTNTRTAPPANALQPSDVKLFVTNLRLLDFDLRNDWPGLTVQTFAAKDADQKQRIGGVEWALFRLFEIWDPQETKEKLQPFFPPLEPLQSRNLRAAFFRSLSELKKNGVLGRESILRKTMLDECKGDKFWEVLALFSTAVLKKVLASRGQNSRGLAAARKLATAPTLTQGQQSSLLPLAIAHKAALVNVLKHKEEKRRRYREFDERLDAKLVMITQRNKHIMATPRSRKAAVSEDDAVAMKKQLKDNWVGNQKWLDIILYGDDIQPGDAFLTQSFATVWNMIESGRRLQDAAPEAGLLESLQARVDEQRTRLRRWQTFQKVMMKDGADQVEKPKSQPTTDGPTSTFAFDDHLKLQLRPSSAKEERTVSRDALRPEYHEIIFEMETELGKASAARSNRDPVPRLQRRTSSFSNKSPTRRRKTSIAGDSTCSPKKGRATKPAPSRKLSRDAAPRISRSGSITTLVDSDATLVGRSSTALPSEARPSSRGHDDQVEETTTPSPVVPPLPAPVAPEVVPDPPRPPTPPSEAFPSEPPVFEPPVLSQEEQLAEQIISSIGNATPSPVKKPAPRPSLTERARMSLARTTSFPPPIAESPASPDALPELPPQQPTAQLDRRASLLDRTRLSIAAMSAQPRPQPKKEKRRESRQSLFPVNQFDTPRNRKSFEAIEEAKFSAGEKTPKEDLFSDEIDYERVFKSRPRVAHSPIFSPDVNMVQEGDDTQAGAEEGSANADEHTNGLGIDNADSDEYDEGVTGVDLGDVDANEDEDGFAQTLEDSPLRRRGRTFA